MQNVENIVRTIYDYVESFFHINKAVVLCGNVENDPLPEIFSFLN